MIELLLPDWPLPAGVQLAISCRGMASGGSAAPWNQANLGLHVGDDAVQVQSNRRQLQSQLTGVKQIQWLDQVHGNDCLTAVGADQALTADACVTRTAGLACAVMTADCLPVLFAAQDGSCVAAAHAGWRGLAAGVLENTIAAMGLPASQLVAWMGPAIGQDAFEVGPEVQQAFAGAPQRCFRAGQGDRLQADIYGLARWRLQQAGIAEIWSENWCTVTQAEKFFSYRRDGQTGRMASLIWIDAG
ncbi:peptidoglycan editing factor PgeF [Oceanobacter mangrovi]|uniref:peptidoglycan editing factor PgeF n=1 Tax=Oceanobacter mangrovi TaxID=2862510 RepID=UPI001C8ED0EB|nr:peptidoglycan editing factor PgeF [Oceanobacter mangrovi]